MKTWTMRSGSASTARPAGTRMSRRRPRSARRAAIAVGRARDQAGDLDPLAPEHDLAARDARVVEQARPRCGAPSRPAARSRAAPRRRWHPRAWSRQRSGWRPAAPAARGRARRGSRAPRCRRLAGCTAMTLERQRALLQPRDLPVALHLDGAGAEALGRGDRRVRAADGLELLLLTGMPEAAHVVGAQQREGVVARQVVPQLLELHRGLVMTFAPQQIDHLAVDAEAHARSRRRRLANHLADAVPEQRPVRHAAHHEGREDLGGVVQAELAGVAGGVQVEPRALRGSRRRSCAASRAR